MQTKAVIAIQSMVLIACGGRTAISNSNEVDAMYIRCDDDVMCVVAVRADDCCQVPYPEFREILQGEACVFFWPPAWSRLSEQCSSQWGNDCSGCSPVIPLWRLAGCNVMQNGCEFIPECEVDEDCVMAFDARECCPCPFAAPERLEVENICLGKVDGGSSLPASCTLNNCPDTPCPPCPENQVAMCSPDQVCKETVSLR